MTQTKMMCPACAATQLLMSERQGVEIDYCPSCRGVWLDRGELDKIIERSAAETAAVPERRPPRDGGGGWQDDRYASDYHRKKRKRSFLEDLFD